MKLAFTICSVSHLGQAKTMADSFLEHNPDYELKIGILDRLGDRIDAAEFAAYGLFEIGALGIPNFDVLLQKYTVFELCCVIRPHVCKFLLAENSGVEKLLFIDSDIFFFNSIESVDSALDTHDILLTPHTFRPFPEDGKYPKEVSFNNAGLYNTGFFALKRSVSTINFLNWWEERLNQYGFVNFMDGMFVDQLWANFVPLFFENVLVSQNLGLNVGYWNLHERNIEFKDDTFTVNEAYPLVFFHFSGFDINKRDKISVHTDRFDLVNRPELQSLFEKYHEKMTQNEYEKYRPMENRLVPQKSYTKWGILREYALRISRKIIRELHG